MSAQNGHVEVCALLLEKGANIDAAMKVCYVEVVYDLFFQSFVVFV